MVQQLTRLISRRWPAFEALPLLDRRSILQETVSILLLLPWSLASLAANEDTQAQRFPAEAARGA